MSSAESYENAVLIPILPTAGSLVTCGSSSSKRWIQLYIFSFLFLIIIGYIGIILFHSDFILFLLGYIGKGRIFYLYRSEWEEIGKEIQLCVEEMSMEDCWLNGRFVPWQSMVNHSRL